MSKKLSTIKEYLENRIATINKHIKECQLDGDDFGIDRFQVMLEEVEDALKVYNQLYATPEKGRESSTEEGTGTSS